MDFENIIEDDLLKVVKEYYRVCQQTPDKQKMVQDPSLLRYLTNLVVDHRVNILDYITKILLLLTELPANAKTLYKSEELRVNLDEAVSCKHIILPPRVLRRLLIVQTRLSNATNPGKVRREMRKTIYGSTSIGSKQLVFTFERPSNEQLLQHIESKCIEVRGVVSISFQSVDGSAEMRCLVRCKENVGAREIAHVLMLAGGFEDIKQLVRTEQESMEAFEYYASQLEQERQEATRKKEAELPKYLDDNLELFDPAQCMATKEQVEAQQHLGGGWLSSIKSLFW